MARRDGWGATGSVKSPRRGKAIGALGRLSYPRWAVALALLSPLFGAQCVSGFGGSSTGWFDYVFFSMIAFFLMYAVVLVVGSLVRIVSTTMSHRDGGPQE